MRLRLVCLVTEAHRHPPPLANKDDTPMKFEFWKGANKQWYWRLRGANGEIIANSEGYRRKRDALRCIKLVQGSACAVVVERP